jgi:hypothetical protein
MELGRGALWASDLASNYMGCFREPAGRRSPMQSLCEPGESPESQSGRQFGLLTHLPGAVPQSQDLPRVVVSQLRRQRVLREVLVADGSRKTIDGLASD